MLNKIKYTLIIVKEYGLIAIAISIVALLNTLYKPNRLVAVVDTITLEVVRELDSKIKFLLTIPITFSNNGKQNNVITCTDLVIDNKSNIPPLVPITPINVDQESSKHKTLSIDLYNYFLNCLYNDSSSLDKKTRKYIQEYKSEHSNILKAIEAENNTIAKELQDIQEYMELINRFKEQRFKKAKLGTYQLDAQVVDPTNANKYLRDKVHNIKNNITISEEKIQSFENQLVCAIAHKILISLVSNQKIMLRFVTDNTTSKKLNYHIMKAMSDDDVSDWHACFNSKGLSGCDKILYFHKDYTFNLLKYSVGKE